MFDISELHSWIMLSVALWALAIMAVLDVAVIWSALLIAKRSDRLDEDPSSLRVRCEGRSPQSLERLSIER